MNKRFLKALGFDLFVLWPAIYFSVAGSGKAQFMGENIVQFLGVVSLIVGLLLFAMSGRLSAKTAESDTYKGTTKAHRVYSVVSTLVETMIIASMGWYWSAAGFLVCGVALYSIISYVEKIRNGKAES